MRFLGPRLAGLSAAAAISPLDSRASIRPAGRRFRSLSAQCRVMMDPPRRGIFEWGVDRYDLSRSTLTWTRTRRFASLAPSVTSIIGVRPPTPGAKRDAMPRDAVARSSCRVLRKWLKQGPANRRGLPLRPPRQSEARRHRVRSRRPLPPPLLPPWSKTALPLPLPAPTEHGKV